MQSTSHPPPRQLLMAYAAALACFLSLDACWLSVMSARLYKPALEKLVASSVDWPAAASFYAVYLTGLVVFAVRPALKALDPGLAARLGSFFGFVAYATYDLTNQATLANWPWTVTAADLVWGTVVSGVSSWASARVAMQRADNARP